MGLGPLRSRRKLFALSLFFAGFAVLCSLIATTATAHAAAGINQQINFQGRMYTTAGNTIPDGTYNLQFKIYQDGDGLTAGDTTGSPAGTLKWTENHLKSASQGVDIKNGFLSVQLGAVTPFGSSVDWNQDTIWLSLQIGNTASCTITTSFQVDCGGDGEMVPMKRLSANAYALNALNANLLGGLSSAGFVQNTTSSALQTNTSLAIQSAADGNETAYLQSRTAQSAAVLSIKGGASQTGDYIKIVDSSNNPKFSIDSTGNANLTGAMGIGSAASAGVQLKITPANSTTISLQVAGSGTASGTNIVQIDGNNGGGIAYNGAGTATTTSGTSQTAATGVFKSANTSGTQTNGLVVDRNGAGGTTTNGINVTNTAGTLTNGLAFNGTIGTDITRSSGTLSANGAGGINLQTNGTTRAAFDTTGKLYLGDGITSATTGTFTLQGSTGAASNAGFTVALQGGTSGTGAVNGGDVLLQGGTSGGSGVQGQVKIASGGFTTATAQNFTASASVTQANVDNFSAIEITSSGGGPWTATVPAPTTKYNGRLLYLQISTISGATTILIAPNGGTTITMSPSTGVTLMWNTTINAGAGGWLNAGADSGSNSYIQNQSTADQAASFRISGTAIAPTFKSKDSSGSGNSDNLVLKSGDANTGSNNSSGTVTLKSGDATGGNASSGSLFLDVGAKTGSGTTGSINIGTNATNTVNGINIGKLTVTTLNQGNLTLGGSAGSGTTFTNNGATINTALAVANDSDGGSLGGTPSTPLTAAQSVDIYTSFTINQTTASQTITIPSPTTTTAGRIIYIANIGSVSFGLLGSTLNNGSTATLLWNGTAWTFAGADGTSINNQKTAAQNGDFWIQAAGGSTGIGRADGGLQSPSLERATSGTLSLGTTANTTALTLGSLGVTTSNVGNLTLGTAGGTGTTFTNNGATVNTALAVANDTNGGVLGNGLTAAQSVDIYTSFTINQTTASQTITIPSPTSATAGRIIYLANIGSVSFGLLGSTLNNGSTATLLWNGSAWTFAGADGTSINNQNAAGQNGDFWIQAGGSSTGVGRADGGFLGPSFERATSGTLSLGTTANTTALTLGSLGVTTSNVGNLTLGTAGGTGTTFTNNGATLNGTKAVLNDSDGGSLGGTPGTPLTAAQSVDIYTSFTVNQTTGSQTITIPSPTNTAAGRIIYIANIGSVSFGLLGSTLNTASTATLVWNGSAWTIAGVGGAGVNAIGTFSNTSIANGGSISGTTLTFGAADTTNPGMVSTTTQSFAGDKTFQTTTNSATAHQVQNANGTTILGVGTIAPGSNLLSNGDFETNTTSWSNKTGGTLTRVAVGTTPAATFYGQAGGQIVLTGASGGAAHAVSLTLSSTYTLSFYVRTASGTATNINAGYTNTGGDQDCLTNQTAVAGGFTRFTCTFTVTTTAGTAVYIKQSTAVSQTIYIDGIEVLAGNAPIPFTLGTLQLNGTITTPVALQNSNDSTTAFQIQNAAGTSNTLIADTLNNIVKVGGVLGLQDGSSSAPSVYVGQADMGLFRVSNNNLGIAVPNSAGTLGFYINGVRKGIATNTGFAVASGCYSFSSNGSDASGPFDSAICRDGVGALGIRSTTTPQTLGIYNTYTNSSNYENATLGFSSNVFNIGTTAAGTGTNRNLSFSTGGTTRATFDNSNSLYLGPGTSAGSPGTFTLQATGSSTTGVAGGILQVQGGNATTGTADGGNLKLMGGAAAGTGSTGLVVLGTPTFSTFTDTGSAGVGCPPGGTVSCTITTNAASNYGAIIIGFLTGSSGLTATLPNPAQGAAAAGRIIYISAATNSADFTLSVNGGGTGNLIAMRQNTTATMVWNGTAWTAAGASSSTTLQAAYDNTLQSAGGAELVVAKTAATNGLTIRDSSVNPVNGALLSVQSSSAASLLSVNSNVTEYASNAGAETAGASSTTFPASTWAAIDGNTTATRYVTAGGNIATGQASVSAVAGANTNTGVKNTLSTTLTANNHYNVSFTAKLASGTFTDMQVIYSIDGTTTGAVTCKSGQAVNTSVWTKVNCAFTAPASGITASNAIFIRQASAAAHTYYLDNLSVTIAADYNLATDGSVDDAGNFATNWSAVASASISRDTGVGNDASSSAKVTAATTAGQGVKNKLSVAPLVSTLYRVTAYVAATASFNTLKVQYTYNNSTLTDCVDYNTTTISTTLTAFTKVTCYITTPANAVTNPYIYFTQTDSTSHTWYVDTFSLTLAAASTPNVQVGGGINGGPTTLFTLDKGASAPIAGDNEALLGSMYYDTTLGKLQCYEADGWGACGSSPDNIVTISPEYTNAVMHGTGVGTMTSDLCSAALGINDGSGSPAQPTICGSNETYNFYKWTSPQASSQAYSIYVTYQLPSTFKSFASGQTSVAARVDSTSNASVQLQIYKNATGSALTSCGGNVTITTSPNTWQSPTASGTADPSTCSFAAGNSIVFKITMSAVSNANAYVGNLNFTYSNK